MTPRHCLLILAFVFLAALQGCGSLSYYTRSISGQLNLVASRQPVDRLIEDPSREPEFREQLVAARDIRQFATDGLALPDNRSYRSYVDTGRKFVSWAVFTAPEFSLTVRNWCFPVFGCVPYRGYFSKEAAIKFGRRAQKQGLDVYVGGIPAYSTLGWFDDPLLNTMFGYSDTYLAEVIFHELSHQRVYVRNDTAFNEAFAVAVEQSGTTKWLRYRADPAALRRYKAARKRNEDFVTLVAETRSQLHQIYIGEGSDAEKRAAKAAAIDNLRARYRRVKARRWNGFSGYDPWFSEPINNAKLASVAVYNELTPAFSRLLEICAGDHERFYRAVEQFAELDAGQRYQALKSANSCG
jgi:predicted aminopeptidase